ncbi:MAG TPA: phenol hydroxylase subunit [Gammaproteobacteria bacterium]|nr:phenol hydroxylase subunit [Gammaproteobacteria bacterium]
MGEQNSSTRYVRVTRHRGDGFVEFDFSIGGDPDLYVELILPGPAFAEFCRVNGVEHLSDAQAARLEADRKKWRQGGL